MINRLAWGHAYSGHDVFHPLAAKKPHQFVIHRNKKFTPARIPLPAGTPPKLIVNTTAFVPLGTDDIQAAKGFYFFIICFPFFVFIMVDCGVLFGACSGSGAFTGAVFRAAAEFYVRTPSRHVSRNCYRPFRARLRNDHRFPCVILGVQYLMANPPAGKLRGNFLGLFDGDCAYQHGLPFFMRIGNLIA